ncbi:DUF4212 domain-containing protein [Extensimonas vulgaris]|uniref:Putative solute:sodium symporter small subunit n=1 Tax=Extensimonas vulgaris TaxID=1031594 RepID=A0A369ANQ2_9BURK|nr:sodium/substrate symporter small subunit [Extensimonas vulgaris]RCX09817.1 putative solute:sodium symporter small subunit [Extensimonas vulgaris]TWI39447.1 putative solute:sodium symporter small subunit [Extensimonas vulgaris]TXD13009.1 DUF4212 domain-containing protein [Extensimonas vulgaris]
MSEKARPETDGAGFGALPPVPDLRHAGLKGVLIALWTAVAFGVPFFARELQAWTTGPWPLGYWLVAQGAVLVFIGIVVFYAWAMNRYERRAKRAASQVSVVQRRGD